MSDYNKICVSTNLKKSEFNSTIFIPLHLQLRTPHACSGTEIDEQIFHKIPVQSIVIDKTYKMI